MFQRILVPLDGSARAERAIPMAARIARAFHSTVILMCVIAPPVKTGKYHLPEAYPRVGTDEELAEAAEYLKAVHISDLLDGIPTERHALTGAIVPTLLAAVTTMHIDLVVLWSHGLTGLTRWTLGSTAHKLVQASPVPLLVLREERQAPAVTELQIVRSLIALDGSPLAEAALKPIAALTVGLARTTGQPGELQMLQVVDVPPGHGRFRRQVDAFYDTAMQGEARSADERYLATVANRFTQGELARYSLRVTTTVATNPDVAHAIVETAEQNQVSVIALATHGRGGIQRWALGSVTERVLHATRTPLLIIRPMEK